jgi:hypothetical protein
MGFSSRLQGRLLVLAIVNTGQAHLIPPLPIFFQMRICLAWQQHAGQSAPRLLLLRQLMRPLPSGERHRPSCAQGARLWEDFDEETRIL